jgi:hypothetical protein
MIANGYERGLSVSVGEAATLGQLPSQQVSIFCLQSSHHQADRIQNKR